MVGETETTERPAGISDVSRYPYVKAINKDTETASVTGDHDSYMLLAIARIATAFYKGSICIACQPSLHHGKARIHLIHMYHSKYTDVTQHFINRRAEEMLSNPSPERCVLILRYPLFTLSLTEPY